jgi:hypothetical protein
MFNRDALGTLLAVLLIASGIGVVVFTRMNRARSEAALAEAVESIQKTPEMKLCERWKDLKNAGDPAADSLLEALAKVPTEPISPEEAASFNASYCLHQSGIRIESVRPVAGNRVLLDTQGSISAPTLQVRSGTHVDSVQGVLFNPTLLVEVRDRKIHAIRPQS